MRGGLLFSQYIQGSFYTSLPDTHSKYTIAPQRIPVEDAPNNLITKHTENNAYQNVFVKTYTYEGYIGTVVYLNVKCKR